MSGEKVSYLQSRLIDQFNDFAQKANDYLGLKIEPLNETGCCFALAQYYMKYSREGRLDEFYELYGFITSDQFRENQIETLKQARPSQEAGNARVVYNNFNIQVGDKSIQFRDLMDFVQGVSKAQVGYKRKMARGRFVDVKGQRELGEFENIAANWETSYLLSCNRENIAGQLERMALENNHSGLILAVKHAIAFRKVGENQYEVYDSNNADRVVVLDSLDQVGDAIMTAFEKVRLLSPEGNVPLAFNGATFGYGDLELNDVLQTYQARHGDDTNEALSVNDGIVDPVADDDESYVLQVEDTEDSYDSAVFDENYVGGVGLVEDVKLQDQKDIAIGCQEILSRYAGDPAQTAAKIYQLYQSAKLGGLVDSYDDFFNQVPVEMKSTVRECIDYAQRVQFVECVDIMPRIEVDSELHSEVQVKLIGQINSYLDQYHNGHLARTDFAANVLELLNQADAVEALPKQQALANIKQAMENYLEGRVVAADLIRDMPSEHAYQRDRMGYNFIDLLMYTGGNQQSFAALCENSGGLVLDPDLRIEDEEISRDMSALRYLLTHGSGATAEYVLSQLGDQRQLVLQDRIILSAVVRAGNFAVAKVFLEQQENMAETIQALSSEPLECAVKFGDVDFANYLVKSQVEFTASSLRQLLGKANPGRLDRGFERAYQNYQADFQEQQQEILAAEQRVDQIEFGQLGSFSKEEFRQRYQQSHAEAFQDLAQWQGVVTHIINSGNQQNILAVFDLALSQGQIDVLREIVASDFKLPPDKEKALFVKAIKQGDMALVASLFEKNNQLVHAKDGREQSMLSIACEARQDQVVGFLLERVKAVEEDRSEPLFYAAKVGDLRVCRDLIRRGSSAYRRSVASNQSPLAGAMLSDLPIDKKEELLGVLVRAERVNTFPHAFVQEAAVAVALSPRGTREDLALLERCFGVDLAACHSASGRNLAMCSLQSGNVALFSELLDTVKIDLSEVDSKGDTLFSIMLANQGVANNPALAEFAQTFMRDYPDLLNQTGNDQHNTPLMLAIRSQNVEVARGLIMQNADLALANSQDCTALHLAISARMDDLVATLVERGAPLDHPNLHGLTPLLSHAKERPTLATLQMLQGNQALDVCGPDGNTALHFAACKDGNTQVVIDLLGQGLNIMQKNQAEPPKTPLDNLLAVQDYRTVVAVLENMSYRDVANNRELLNGLKEHRDSILRQYKAELGGKALEGDQGRQVARDRVNTTLLHRNGLARVFKSKVRLSEGQLLDRKFMKSLGAQKREEITGRAGRDQSNQGGAKFR